MQDYRSNAAIDQYHNGTEFFCAVADNDIEREVAPWGRVVTGGLPSDPCDLPRTAFGCPPIVFATGPPLAKLKLVTDSTVGKHPVVIR
jgi:hypothetical protein